MINPATAPWGALLAGALVWQGCGGGNGVVQPITDAAVDVAVGPDMAVIPEIDGPARADASPEVTSPIDRPGDGPIDALRGLDGAPDGGPCPPGQVLRYENPGCGAQARPVCGSPTQDACFRAVCSCRGQTISRCEFAPEPFASFGPCADGGGADGPAIFGCPGGCGADGVCVIPRSTTGDNRGSCRAIPAMCRPEAGARPRPPDGAAAGCDQCIGFTVCNGAYGCLGGGTTYTCGI